jgi:hypothetical protein
LDAAIKKRLGVGLMLIVLGLGLYGMQHFDERSRPLILALLGGLLIIGYFATRAYVLLVLGGILGGLGIGLFGERRWFVVHEFTEIGLAIGFLLIYLARLAYERRSHWWPLVPALVFFLLGFHAWRRFRLFVFSSRGWPLLLVILGALVLLGALGRRKPARSAD